MNINKISDNEYDKSNDQPNDIIVNNYDIASNNHNYQEVYNI